MCIHKGQIQEYKTIFFSLLGAPMELLNSQLVCVGVRACALTGAVLGMLANRIMQANNCSQKNICLTGS